MNQTSAAVACAVTFVWLGMVVGISFIEAPLKFRAPGVTIPIGLGIGRLVFRALNLAEVVAALTVILAVAVGGGDAPAAIATTAASAILTVQLTIVRPPLNRRSDRVLAGENPPRSRAHLAYVGLESAKVIALITLGVLTSYR
jgi:hypothetical protein